MTHMVDKALTPEGVHLTLEDWSKEYSNIEKKYTVGTYPIAKKTTGGTFGPRKGESFRCALNFVTFEEAADVFEKLKKGSAKIEDYAEHVEDGNYRDALLG